MNKHRDLIDGLKMLAPLLVILGMIALGVVVPNAFAMIIDVILMTLLLVMIAFGVVALFIAIGKVLGFWK